MAAPSNRIDDFIAAVLRHTSKITDRRVIDAMRSVDRALFLPPRLRSHAYDTVVVALDGYTLSEPGLVGYMVQCLNLRPSDVVLDIGSGSGYHAAIMSRLCKAVYGVEVLPHAVERSRQALKDANCNNVRILCGDGWDGWEDNAPYDAVNVACAADRLPVAILHQMRVGGRMIIPLESCVDDSSYQWQELSLIIKESFEPIDSEGLPPLSITKLEPVRFVPMTHSYH